MEEKPHHYGHRDRLRERFRSAGSEALADYELMELILFRALPRRDVKSLAKRLIQHFGGFAEVINADPERLNEIAGIGQSVITEMKIIQAAALRMMQANLMNRPVVSSWQALLDYCTASMAHNKIEEFRILFLDNKNAIIADESQQKGTVNHTPVYPREVVKRALELGASSFILVHNHPSGDPTPSRADINMTKQVVEAARALNISVHDHLIIGKGAHASFKTLGLL